MTKVKIIKTICFRITKGSFRKFDSSERVKNKRERDTTNTSSGTLTYTNNTSGVSDVSRLFYRNFSPNSFSSRYESLG